MNIWFIRVWFVVNEKIRKKMEHLHYNIFSACIVMKTKSIPNLKFKDLGNDAFSVPTPPEHISLNSVILLVAKKQSGKTFFASNLMNQLKQVKACDRIFVISDTFNSNKKLLDHLDIDPDDIFSPNDPNVIPEITKRIEAERDDLLEYRQNMKLVRIQSVRVQNRRE